MKKYINRTMAIRSLVFMVIATALFSFSRVPGGDSYTIYLNDKLLIQHYVYKGENLKPISLGGVTANDILKVHYSHCGKMGVARVLTVRDNGLNTLKTWKYPDSSDGSEGAMTCKAADIVSLQHANPNRKLLLYYSSEQLPEGRVLATINANDGAKASLK